MVAAIAAVSCSRNDVNEYYAPLEIMFNVVARPNTKALGTEYPEDVPFAVWAYSLGENQRWESEREQAKVEIAGESALRTDDGLWKPSGGLQWLSPYVTMNFFALSPYGRGGYNDEYGIFFNDYGLSEGMDLMFVDGVTDITKRDSQGLITLSFRRAMARLSFNVQSYLPEGRTVSVRSLTIGNIYTSGDFRSRPVPHWIPEGEKTELVAFHGEKSISETLEQLNDAIFVIPQDGEVEFILDCDILDGGRVLSNQRLSKTVHIGWNVGKYSTYNLKITRNLELNADTPLGGRL